MGEHCRRGSSGQGQVWKVDLWTPDTQTSLVWNAADAKHVAAASPFWPLDGCRAWSRRAGGMTLKALCNPTNAISPPQGFDKGKILSISEHLPPLRFSPERPGDLRLRPSFLIRLAHVPASVAAVLRQRREAGRQSAVFAFVLEEIKKHAETRDNTVTIWYDG